MIHYSHRFRIYKKQAHLLVAFGVLVLPLAFIMIVGRIGSLSASALLYALGLSLYRLLAAYAISLALGTTLAVTLGQGTLGDFFIPVFDLMQNLPSFALIPVFALVFGYTNTMAIFFAASSVLWPILFYVLTAVRTARTDLNEAAAIFGAASGIKRILYYLIPLSFPAIVTGSIVGISIGWEAVIGVEIIGLAGGIGVFLNSAAASDKTVLTLGVVSLLLVVFSVNKLVWLPLLKKTQHYAE